MFRVCWCCGNTSDRIHICLRRVSRFLAVFRLISPVQSITGCVGPAGCVLGLALVWVCALRFSLCVSHCFFVYVCSVLDAGAGLSWRADAQLNAALVFFQAQLNSRDRALPSLLAHWEQSPALHLLLFQRARPGAGAAPAHCDPRHSKPTRQCHHHPQRHWWGRGQQIQTCQVGSSFSKPVLSSAQATRRVENTTGKSLG